MTNIYNIKKQIYIRLKLVYSRYKIYFPDMTAVTDTREALAGGTPATAAATQNQPGQGDPHTWGKSAMGHK